MNPIPQPNPNAARPAPSSTDPGNGDVHASFPTGPGIGQHHQVHVVPGQPEPPSLGVPDRSQGAIAAVNASPEAIQLAALIATSGAGMMTPVDPVVALHDAAQAAQDFGGQP